MSLQWWLISVHEGQQIVTYCCQDTMLVVRSGGRCSRSSTRSSVGHYKVLFSFFPPPSNTSSTYDRLDPLPPASFLSVLDSGRYFFVMKGFFRGGGAEGAIIVVEIVLVGAFFQLICR